MSSTRREFLKRSLASASAVAFPAIVPATALGGGGRPAPSERIVMGTIGAGGRGSYVMSGFMKYPRVQMVAICDVFRSRREGRPGLEPYADFRELLARDDIEAVVIGTPDHWHAIPAVEACKRGIDVYCEKPLSLTIAEGRAMVDAARRYNRVFSCGSQRVRGDYGRLADIVASGAIGKVTEAHCGVGGPSRPCGLSGKPVPEGLDWDMWLGPAPYQPYHPFRCARAYGLRGKGWRTWRDYSGGMMTDWGGHIFGAAMYALQLDHTGPVEILPPGGQRRHLTFVFADGVKILRNGGAGKRLAFRGTEGVAPRRGLRRQGVSPLRTYHRGARNILEDFLACVRTRRRPFRDVAYAHRVATLCHLGNIAFRLERPLRWDSEKERFIDAPQADRLLARPKREPWRT